MNFRVHLRSGARAGLALVAGLAGLNPASAELPAPPASMARAAHVLLTDMNSGQVLAEAHADERFLPASLTKVMTAYGLFERIDARRLRLDATFRASPLVVARYGGQGTSLWLKAGDAVPVDQLLQGLAVISANDAAAVLGENAGGSLGGWFAEMNRLARDLGMANSHFASPNGLPDGGQTYVTARDLTRLATALIGQHPALYHRYFGQETFLWRGQLYRNRDPVLGVVAGADGIKTGHTAEAGYNFLGSALRDGRRLILVVAGAASEADRAVVSRDLLEWGFARWSSIELFAPGKTVGEARVQQGDERRVPLVAGHVISATMPAGTRLPIALRVVYRGPLVAPVARGQQVATLEIRVGDMAPGIVPLYAGSSVARAGLLDRLWNGLAGVFDPAP